MKRFETLLATLGGLVFVASLLACAERDDLDDTDEVEISEVEPMEAQPTQPAPAEAQP